MYFIYIHVEILNAYNSTDAVEAISIFTISNCEEAYNQILEEHRESVNALLGMGLNLYLINGSCYVQPNEIGNKIRNGSKAFDHWIRVYIKNCKQQHGIDITEKVQICAEGLPSFEKKTRFVLIKLFHEYWINSYCFKKLQKKVTSDKDKISQV